MVINELRDPFCTRTTARNNRPTRTTPLVYFRLQIEPTRPRITVDQEVI